MFNAKYLFFLSIFLLLGKTVLAQTVMVKGTVNNEASEVLPGTKIEFESNRRQIVSDENGFYVAEGLRPGNLTITYSRYGYYSKTVDITIRRNQSATIDVTLKANPFAFSQVNIISLPPNMKESKGLVESKPRTTSIGELLRTVNSTDIVKRGVTIFQPTIRGLRQNQIGVYKDGIPFFPTMSNIIDSPISNIDPASVQNIKIQKGPYALAMGGGNFSTIEIETPPLNSTTPFEGNVSTGYTSNLQSYEVATTLKGKIKSTNYQVHSAWREGNDYESADGKNIPANYNSKSLRGALGIPISEKSNLTFSSGYRLQNGLDNPGFILNTETSKLADFSIGYDFNQSEGFVRNVSAKVFLNDDREVLDNNNKPYSEPDSTRTPSYGINFRLRSHSQTKGYRSTANFETGSLSFELGSDYLQTSNDFNTSAQRIDNNQLIANSTSWPDSERANLGFFSTLSAPISTEWSATANIRFDYFTAETDTLSEIFLQTLSEPQALSTSTISASATATYTSQNNWTFGVGAASVTRPPSSLELYSDRIPSPNAQNRAEFLGNPTLVPERANQVDMWILVNYQQFTASINVFGRAIDNYISVQAINLPKQFPFSTETSYQYINGEATFWGFNINSEFNILPNLKYKTGINYLKGQDFQLDESAIGMIPFTIYSSLNYGSEQIPLNLEVTLRYVSDQYQVASARGETTTDSYTLSNIATTLKLSDNAVLKVSGNNLLDENYSNHLNSENPYTGEKILEPGRYYSLDLNIKF